MSEQRKILTQVAVTALALNAAQYHRPPRSGEIKEEKSRFIANKTRAFIKAGHSKVTARLMAKSAWRENRDE